MKTKLLGSLMILAVFLTACASGNTASISPTQAASSTQSNGAVSTDTSAPVASTSPNQIQISGFAFNPNSLTIKVGDTVTWTNLDSAAHTVVADDGSFKSDRLITGATFQYTFNTAGTFTYKCGIHASMTGTLIVQP